MLMKVWPNKLDGTGPDCATESAHAPAKRNATKINFFISLERRQRRRLEGRESLLTSVALTAVGERMVNALSIFRASKRRICLCTSPDRIGHYKLQRVQTNPQQMIPASHKRATRSRRD